MRNISKAVDVLGTKTKKNPYLKLFHSDIRKHIDSILNVYKGGQFPDEDDNIIMHIDSDLFYCLYYMDMNLSDDYFNDVVKSYMKNGHSEKDAVAEAKKSSKSSFKYFDEMLKNIGISGMAKKGMESMFDAFAVKERMLEFMINRKIETTNIKYEFNNSHNPPLNKINLSGQVYSCYIRTDNIPTSEQLCNIYYHQVSIVDNKTDVKIIIHSYVDWSASKTVCDMPTAIREMHRLCNAFPIVTEHILFKILKYDFTN